MDLKWLKTFVTVYEVGNFRLAAEKLFISQPSISVHIKLLEESLNTALFDRNHTQVALTEEGKYFYILAKELLEKVDESKQLLNAFSNKKQIQVSVALSPLLVHTKLPQIIYEFMSCNPNYQIEIIVEDSPKIDELIKLKKVHLAICIGKSRFKEIHSEKILSSPLELVYPTSFQTKETAPNVILNELFKKYPLFVGNLEAVEPIINSLEHEHSLLRKNTIQQSNIAKQLIVGGLGIAFLPKMQVEEDVKEGRLKILQLPYGQHYNVHTYMKHLRESDRLIPLIDFIREHYK